MTLDTGDCRDPGIILKDPYGRLNPRKDFLDCAGHGPALDSRKLLPDLNLYLPQGLRHFHQDNGGRCELALKQQAQFSRLNDTIPPGATRVPTFGLGLSLYSRIQLSHDVTAVQSLLN
jgi:hypothetical protein